MRAVDHPRYWIEAGFDRRSPEWADGAYPFNLPVLRGLHQLVDQMESQLIIATHSPIILACPDAWIYQAGEHGLERVEYEDTEHYTVTRSFLNRRRTCLDILLEPDPRIDEIKR